MIILDDFGVSPLKAAEARDLLEIVEDRTNQSSTIITSQLPIKEWHSYLHNSYKIELEGESQRKERAKKAIKQEE